MDLIGVKEIMRMTGRGRDTVMKWLRDETCPTFPRDKNCTYLIDRNDFITWYAGRTLRKKGRR